MTYRWSHSDRALSGDAIDDSLLEIYHEASKLHPGVAGPGAREASDDDLYLMSRSFRSYRNRPAHELPAPAPSSASLQSILSTRRSRSGNGGRIQLQSLATVIGQAVGPTTIARRPASDIVQTLRSCPSAGALYPIDVYVAVSRVEGVPPGTYHYNVIRHALEQLSAVDPHDALHTAFLRQDAVDRCAAALLLVAAFDRCAAKYGELRAYRLALLDAGHAAENLLLVAEQERLAALPMQGFDDDALAAHLGVDGRREAVVHSILLGAV